MFTGIFVNLVRVLPIYGDSQAGARSLEIVVRLGPRSRPKLLLVMPFGHHVVATCDSLAVETAHRGCLFWTRLMRRRVIRENENVFAIVVIEIVANPLLFHQP